MVIVMLGCSSSITTRAIQVYEDNENDLTTTASKLLVLPTVNIAAGNNSQNISTTEQANVTDIIKLTNSTVQIQVNTTVLPRQEKIIAASANR